MKSILYLFGLEEAERSLVGDYFRDGALPPEITVFLGILFLVMLAGLDGFMKFYY
jgi:hypothetical protein